jgi:hypothetical protein
MGTNMRGTLRQDGASSIDVEVTAMFTAPPLGQGIVMWSGTILITDNMDIKPDTGSGVLTLDDGHSGDIIIVKIDQATAYFTGIILSCSSGDLAGDEYGKR